MLPDLPVTEALPALTAALRELGLIDDAGRAVVTSDVRVMNQHGDCVMEYTVKRLVAGRPGARGGEEE